MRESNEPQSRNGNRQQQERLFCFDVTTLVRKSEVTFDDNDDEERVIHQTELRLLLLWWFTTVIMFILAVSSVCNFLDSNVLFGFSAQTTHIQQVTQNPTKIQNHRQRRYLSNNNDSEPIFSSQSTNRMCPLAMVPSSSAIRIAFIGNSMLATNDCPNLLQQMILASGLYNKVEQESCLRRGATLKSLWSNGCEVYLPENILVADSSTGHAHVEKGPRTVKSLLLKYRTIQTKLNTSRTSSDDILYDDEGAEHDGYDFVVINDNSLGPARSDILEASIETIKKRLAPLLAQSGRRQRNATDSSNIVKSTTIPVLVQTAAYRIPGIRNTSDLGDFTEFTKHIAEGVRKYEETFNTAFEALSFPSVLDDDMELYYGKRFATSNTDNASSNSNEQENSYMDYLISDHPTAKVAIVGEAYQYLHENDIDLFHKLYNDDDNFHPSPHGTYLQACVLFLTLFPNHPLPFYSIDLWDHNRAILTEVETDDGNDDAFSNINFTTSSSTSRKRHYPSSTEFQLPTVDEAHALERAAWIVVTGLDSSPFILSPIYGTGENSVLSQSLTYCIDYRLDCIRLCTDIDKTSTLTTTNNDINNNPIVSNGQRRTLRLVRNRTISFGDVSFHLVIDVLVYLSCWMLFVSIQ